MYLVKEKICFIKIARKLLENGKKEATKVLFRLFPIRGVIFDKANLTFFEQTIQCIAQGGVSPIALSVITLEDFSIRYAENDVCNHEGLTQDQISINNKSISGNFLLIASSYLLKECEATTRMDMISSILRLSYGSFIVWPKPYEFMTNIEAEDPAIWFPCRIQKFYNPAIDGPFIGNEESLKSDIKSLIHQVLQKGNEEISVALSLIEDAAKEGDERKKIFLYFSAIQVISNTDDLNGLITVMMKHYKNSEGWNVLKKYFGENLLLKPVTILRHGVIHNGRNPQSFPILERYLQILCLEVLEYRLKIPSRNILEKFIVFYGTSWWLD